uniref:BTB domain-containing protein n=1 Tax=Leersia perrieri TaxID=77586 RepID=A0A0D9VPR1_9ORYZ
MGRNGILAYERITARIADSPAKSDRRRATIHTHENCSSECIGGDTAAAAAAAAELRLPAVLGSLAQWKVVAGFSSSSRLFPHLNPTQIDPSLLRDSSTRRPVMESPEPSSSSSPVLLNIGGKQYATTIETLTQREPNSMLAAMFSGRHTLPRHPDTGMVFVDRDGKHFRHVLNWLRDGAVPAMSESEYQQLLREAEYYQLLGLADCLNEKLGWKKDEIFSEAELTRKDVIKCIQSPRVRFRGVNLSGLDLSKLDLSEVDFSYACIKNANFNSAYLRKAKFRLTEATCSSFQGANLHECELIGANLEGSVLDKANLQSVNLQDACLKQCCFIETDLRSAHLQGANLVGANLSGANLEGANLKGAKLAGTNFECANLQRAYLREVDLRETHLTGAKLGGANLLGAIR